MTFKGYETLDELAEDLRRNDEDSSRERKRENMSDNTVTYCVIDACGNMVTDGLGGCSGDPGASAHIARTAARKLADSRGRSFWLHASDGSLGEDGEEFAPANDAAQGGGEDKSGFRSMHEAGHAVQARRLAAAFAESHDLDQVYACLRYERRRSGMDLWPWLQGNHWFPYQDIGGVFSAQCFDTAADEAHDYLDDEGLS